MLRRLGIELEGKGNKAVLITDKTMAELSQQLVEVVKGAGYEVKVWDGAEPEPSIEVAQAGSKILLDFEPQLVIGFGGGSAIDTAKAAWLFYERPDLASAESDKAIGPKTKLDLRKKARFMAVPTTSGTGSDATWAIILTDTANHRKIAIANNDIVPDISLLVPEFTVGLPKALTASTGLDVLGHALDGYTARQQTDFSDGLCLQAMKLTFEWLPKACRDGSDLVAREKMQNAATIAGLGFGNSNTSLCHALAHSPGATFGMPHGRAVGIALPYSLEYISSNPPIPNAPDPIQRLNTAARFVGIDARPADEAIKQLIQKIRELQKEIGEPLNLKEAGVTEKQLAEKMDTLVLLAGKDVNILSSPCECKDEQLKQLFQYMWEGTKIF
jgi:alcohol dehydrogenase class IV